MKHKWPPNSLYETLNTPAMWKKYPGSPEWNYDGQFIWIVESPQPIILPVTKSFSRGIDDLIGKLELSDGAYRLLIEHPEAFHFEIGFIGTPNDDGVYEQVQLLEVSMVQNVEDVWFDTGKPPARAKAEQLEVKESDMELLDKFLSLRKDGDYWDRTQFTGRYTRKP